MEIDGGGCWRWRGRRVGGCPVFAERSARRVVWEDEQGPLPAGVRLRPGCGHGDCVRPDHAEIVELHRHGARRYDTGCRCPTCRRARQARQRQYRLGVVLDAGRVPARPTSADPVRAHLVALAAGGWTCRAIARRADVSTSTLTRLRRRGVTTVMPATAVRLLAVGGMPRTIEDVPPCPRRQAADPVRLHLERLAAGGWSWVGIQRRSGVSESTLRRLRDGLGRTIEATAAARLLALAAPW